MIVDGLWIDRRHRLPSPHQPRRRRECLGELVQIDGSEHAWFEDRGPMCTLLAFIDDATSRLMQLRFVARNRRSTISARHVTTWKRMASRWRSTATSTASFGSTTRTRGGDRDHPVRPRAVGAEHRHHLRQQPAGQGPGGARIRHAAGPAGQGTAAGGHLHDRGSERLAAGVHRHYKRALAVNRRTPRTCTGSWPRGTIWTRSWPGGRNGPSRRT